MTMKLKPSPLPTTPFTWDDLSSYNPTTPTSLPSPPTSWLSARDMKLFGAQPLTATSDIGLVKCKQCNKPVLRSFMGDHVDNCASIRDANDANKQKTEGHKKRKASPSPDDPALPLKKTKPAAKVTKGRLKGPLDFNKQCGVINDKGLPCSRSLTCKSHSMGAKRAVEGRTRNYDDLLLEWQRANNPNFVEPVKRETKAEKKERREREKLEKKRLAGEAAVALGLDPSSIAGKKAHSAGGLKKVGKKAAAAAAAAVRLAGDVGDDPLEDLDNLDSDAEVDELVRAVRIGQDKGVIGAPLGLPSDVSSWFVQRRERARCCRGLLLGALGGAPATRGLPRSANLNTVVPITSRLM